MSEGRRVMNRERLAREMQILAEARITEVAGARAALLNKTQVTEVFGLPRSLIDRLVTDGRIPTVRVGERDLIQRVVVVEGLVRGI
jgi:hypothetical protein